MQQKHVSCRNSVVLIQIKNGSQCGIILACDKNFSYVLTIKNSMINNCKGVILITSGDESEKNFKASNVVVKSSKYLSILLLQNGIETVGAKEPVQCNSEDDLQEV